VPRRTGVSDLSYLYCTGASLTVNTLPLCSRCMNEMSVSPYSAGQAASGAMSAMAIR
jgi:hypothetical protein